MQLGVCRLPRACEVDIEFREVWCYHNVERRSMIFGEAGSAILRDIQKGSPALAWMVQALGGCKAPILGAAGLESERA